MAVKFTGLQKKVKQNSASTPYYPESANTSDQQPEYSVYTLPLQLWIDVNVSGDTTLIPNWHEIFEQYCDLTGDKNAGEIFATERTISVLKQKIYIVKLIVAQLANSYDADLIAILRNEFFFFTENLDEILSLLISDEVALEVAEAELVKITASNGDKKATEFDYTSNIIALSKFQGWRIDTKIVTLAEYIAISNKYQAHIDYMKRNPTAAAALAI